jgi:hypothetical protein
MISINYHVQWDESICLGQWQCQELEWHLTHFFHTNGASYYALRIETKRNETN